MINYKKYIEGYLNFPLEGVNYLDMNPLYKEGQLRRKLVEDCISQTWKLLRNIDKLDIDKILTIISRIQIKLLNRKKP